MFGAAVSAFADDIPGAADARAGDIGRHEKASDVNEWMNPSNGVYGIHAFAVDENDWDSQFFIVFADEVVPVGTPIGISFEYRKTEGSGLVQFNAQGHADPHVYVNNDGWYALEATEEWQTYEAEIEATGEIRTFGVNASLGREDGTLLLRNIIIEVNYEEAVATLETDADDAEIEDPPVIEIPEAPDPYANVPYDEINTWDDTDADALASAHFVGREANGRLEGSRFVARTVKYGDDNVFAFKADPEDVGSWDCQFFAYFELEGESIDITSNVTISFDYKTDYEDAGPFNQTNGNNENAYWGVIRPSTEWQSYSYVLSVDDIPEEGYKYFEYHLGYAYPEKSYNVFLKNVVLKVDGVVVASSNALTPVEGVEITDSIVDNSIWIDGLKYSKKNSEQVTLIGFDRNHNLKNITIPATVTIDSVEYTVSDIGTSAFQYGDSLVSVTIPNTIIEIGDYAFSGCENLESLTIPQSVTFIGEWAFNECSKLTSVEIPNSITYINYSLFRDCKNLTKVKISNSVTTIYDYAFAGCTKLASINIPSSVTSLGNDVFTGDVALTSLVIPESVTEIGSGTFNQCSGLKSITLPNSMQIIHYYQFFLCSSLESMVIPNSVWYIYPNAYQYCSNLKSLVLGNNVNGIYSNAFANCDSLRTITVNRTTPPELYEAFGELDDEGLGKITLRVPRGSKANYEAAETWNKMNIVEFGTCNLSLYGYNCDNLLGAGDFEIGSTVSIYARPYNSYRFVRWDDGSTDNPRLVTLTQDTVLTAITTEKYYMVKMVAADPSQGYITGNARSRADNWSYFYAYGAGNYVFDHWDDGSTSYQRAIRVTQDTTITAYFRKSFLCQLTLSSDDYTMGTVSNNRSVVAGNATYIEANAYTGYRFVKWSDNVTNSYRTIYVEKDTNLVAFFEPLKSYTIFFAVADTCTGMGTVSVESQKVFANNEVKSTAVPAEGYVFKGWYDINGWCASYSSTIYCYPNVDSLQYFAHFAPAANIEIENTTTCVVPFSGTNYVTFNIGDTLHVYDSEGKYSSYLNSNEGYLQIQGKSGYVLKIEGTYETESGYDRLIIYKGTGTNNIVARWEGSGSPSLIVDDSVATFYFHSDGSVTYPGFELNVTMVKTVDLADVPYNVVIASNDTALGKVSINNIIEVGDVYAFSISAQPVRGARFNEWSDDDYDMNRVVEVSSDITLTANFEALKGYTVTLQSADTAMGKITGAASGTFYQGEWVEIKAVANSAEFRFAKWTDGNRNSYRYFTVDRDTTFTAVFKRNQAFTVNFVSNDTTLGTVSGSGVYYDGEYVTPKVAVKTNCYFAGWSDGYKYTDHGYEVICDTTFTAIFEAQPHKFSAVSNDTTMGKVSYYCSERLNSVLYRWYVNAYAKDGYVFKGWSNGNIAASQDVYAYSDTVLTATFEPVKYNITLAECEHGKLSLTDYQQTSNVTSVRCYASAENGYCFAAWSDGVDNTISRVFAVTSDTTIGAEFVKFPYNINLTCDENIGTVEYSTANASLLNPIVYIEATVKPGYAFSHWSDGNTNSYRALSLNADLTLEAIFVEMPIKVYIVSSDTAAGKVTSNVYSWNNERTSIDFWVSSVSKHYHFVKWSDGSTETSRYQTFYSDTTITAIFALDVHTVKVAAKDATMGKATASATEVEYGKKVTLTATANEGYKFVKWSDGNTNETREVVVEGNIELTAEFEEEVGPGDAIADDAAASVNIFAFGNTIVVENADADVFVYDAFGRLIAKQQAGNQRIEIQIANTGIYVVKVGNAAERVMVN